LTNKKKIPTAIWADLAHFNYVTCVLSIIFYYHIYHHLFIGSISRDDHQIRTLKKKNSSLKRIQKEEVIYFNCNFIINRNFSQTTQKLTLYLFLQCKNIQY